MSGQDDSSSVPTVYPAASAGQSNTTSDASSELEKWFVALIKLL